MNSLFHPSFSDQEKSLPPPSIKDPAPTSVKAQLQSSSLHVTRDWLSLLSAAVPRRSVAAGLFCALSHAASFLLRIKALISCQPSIVLLACNVSAPINWYWVQLLEQPLFLAHETPLISPSSDSFMSVSDCLHIFCRSTSQKNLSPWLQAKLLGGGMTTTQMETHQCFKPSSVVTGRQGAQSETEEGSH